MKKFFSLGFLLGCFAIVQGQDSADHRTLEVITLSASKWEQQRNEVPNKITSITRRQVLLHQPQTAADMLGQSGSVFIQKSQLGGGSPMIRGFATNRVLIVVDGVRMNNAIYRSGNLQNVISIDPLALQKTEVIFGPGSLIYGSDAIGGVMDFQTLQPQFSDTEKRLVTGSALVRYATANKERTGHADLNFGGKKISILASYSFSDFDDLRMGKHGPDQNYLRPEYVVRENGKDTIVKNGDARLQRFSGYNQHNLLAKLRYRLSGNMELQYSFHYAHTGNAPRYDRLIQYRSGALRFAEWSYGPMIWKMHNLQALYSKASPMADAVKLTVAVQDYKESRIDRPRNSLNRTIQSEEVDAKSINLDATKKYKSGELYYGLEWVYNKVGSAGKVLNINTTVETPFSSRYPDGSTWMTAGVYGSYKYRFSESLILSAGARYSYNILRATFDTSFVKFPFTRTALEDGAVTGNAGLVYRPGKEWQLNFTASTGYRMPNVDDMGKLFESTPGILTVPNPGLKPEYAVNLEAGVVKNIPSVFRIELTGFYTTLNDAIVRRPFRFNGADSIELGGARLGVEALQNVAHAKVWGLQAMARYHLTQSLYIQTALNWINGKETDDAKDEQVPLRHAPPFYGAAQLNYSHKKLQLELNSYFNGAVSNEDLAPSEAAKTDIYAKDENGRPYSPAWTTLNLKASYSIHPAFTVSAGWENITNRRYRPYSSGIVAAGSNLILSLRAQL